MTAEEIKDINRELQVKTRMSVEKAIEKRKDIGFAIRNSKYLVLFEKEKLEEIDPPDETMTTSLDLAPLFTAARMATIGMRN